MSRRGGSRQPEGRREATFQSSRGGRGPDGGGRGRGRGGPPTSSPAPISVASSSSAPPPAPAETLSSDLQKQLTLQAPSAPSSSKSIRLPDRPGYGTIGMKTVVRANHFLVEIAENVNITHYDVSIYPSVTSKKVNRNIINRLVSLYKNSHLNGMSLAYDGTKNLYTAKELAFQSKEFKVLFDDGRREREYTIAIKYASKVDIHHLLQFLHRRQLDCPQDTIQALDVALRELPSNRYTVVGRSFFSPEFRSKGELPQGLEYWRGFHQSLRPSQMGLSLNIDVSATAFYEPTSVIDFVVKHFSFNISKPLSEQDRVKVKKALRGVKVALAHGERSRSYRIVGVSREPLSQLWFLLDDQSTKKYVVQYFRDKYNVALRHVSLPALQAGSDLKPIYLPMELCTIVAGQRYSKRLNEDQVSALLRAACQRPHQREGSIKAMIREQNFKTDLLEEFGISVRQNLASVDARVLPPPRLRYHDTGRKARVDPEMGKWNMIDLRMVNGAKVNYWTCINFSQKVDRGFPYMFCGRLISMCNSKGMICNPDPLLPIASASPYQIEKTLYDISNQSVAKLASMKFEGRLQLLIIILPDKKGSYGMIKRICETELGIVTQCCQPKKASKLENQYLENVSLKMNVKVGGRNNVLNDAIERRIPLLTDRPTIIFGADVTHPQPGEDSGPSIAAVVASMDWPEVTKYKGLVSSQRHRDEIIQDLFSSYSDPEKGIVHRGMIKELLISFYKSTKFKPERIIFYRDGVSEGQFSQVLLHEMDAIRKACASLQEGYLPPVTFVVVQKRHHTRLFPTDNRTDRSGNILPGTVVDSKICHPREFDFYLNSHAGIQGTSRPAHYHVLFDENRFSADQLQLLTNSLCYTYARCTRSLSIVPPAHYAHLAAFRARYYIEGETSDDASSESPNTRVEVRLPQVKDNVKEVMFYC